MSPSAVAMIADDLTGNRMIVLEIHRLARKALGARQFADPPREARPWTRWFWMNGNVSTNGITHDLEAMKRMGLGGATICANHWMGLKPGPVKCLSDEWYDCVVWAGKEADRLGLELADSFQRLSERMPCEDMRLLTSSVRLTTQTGGSLADVLGEMTEMIRGRRDFAERVKTMTAQGRFEGLVLAAMPVVAFVIFYFIQPEMMSMLFTTIIGWTAIGVVIVLETIGFIVISHMTKIEV